jgi:hypothetical protein
MSASGNGTPTRTAHIVQAKANRAPLNSTATAAIPVLVRILQAAAICCHSAARRAIAPAAWGLDAARL